MYYQNYEDYMRSVLGYPTQDLNTYNSYYEPEMYRSTREIEELYPDVYKNINPIVSDVCSRCSGNVTKESLEDMVDEVYNKIVNNNEMERFKQDHSATVQQNQENTSPRITHPRR